MSEPTEADIISSILEHIAANDSICIKIDRESGPSWLRYHDGDWELASHNTDRDSNFQTLTESTVKSILKANYYQLLPTANAVTETGEPVWDATKDYGDP